LRWARRYKTQAYSEPQTLFSAPIVKRLRKRLEPILRRQKPMSGLSGLEKADKEAMGGGRAAMDVDGKDLANTVQRSIGLSRDDLRSLFGWKNNEGRAALDAIYVCGRKLLQDHGDRGALERFDKDFAQTRLPREASACLYMAHKEEGILEHEDHSLYLTVVASLTDDDDTLGGRGSLHFQLESSPDVWVGVPLAAGQVVAFKRIGHRVPGVIRSRRRITMNFLF